MRIEKKKRDSVRQLRVAHDIKELMSKILQTDRPYDSNLETLIVSITSVQVSASLQDVKIFVLPMDKDKSGYIMEYLQKHTTYFKTILGQKLQLKFVPNIKFFFDESYDYADHIDDVFKKAGL